MSMYGVPYAGVSCGPGRAKQSMKDECDINLIMAQYVKTGMLSHISQGVPEFLDVSEVGDYRTALANVRAAEEYFMGLPPAVRLRFENDVLSFMEFVQAGSDDDLRELGLEVLGDRRARSRHERRTDTVIPDGPADVPPDPEGSDEAGTLGT